jgi:hypothetical protein
VGLGEIDGEIIEGVVFEARPARSGAVWFYDADAFADGEHGMSGVESNPWVPTFRWTTDLAAGLPVVAAGGGAATLRLRCWGKTGPPDPQRLSVRLGTHLVGEADLDDHPREYAWSVPYGLFNGRPQPLTLRVDRLVVPAARDTASRDERTLGVAIDWIALDPESPTTSLLH